MKPGDPNGNQHVLKDLTTRGAQMHDMTMEEIGEFLKTVDLD